MKHFNSKAKMDKVFLLSVFLITVFLLVMYYRALAKDLHSLGFVIAGAPGSPYEADASAPFPNVFIPRRDTEAGKKTFDQHRSCGPFPYISQLTMTDISWQGLVTPHEAYFLLNAYFDDRPRNNDTGPFIKVIAVIHSSDFELKHNASCQLWHESYEGPVFSKGFLKVERMWENLAFSTPYQYDSYLLTCRVPDHVRGVVPQAVSLVTKRCDKATNVLKVMHNRIDKMKGVAVCVRALDLPYTDISHRLAEWIELVRLLGGEDIFFHFYHVDPRVEGLLKYYASIGYVDVRIITLPGGESTHKHFTDNLVEYKLRMEVVHLTDCLYRNLYTHKYVAVMDVDEVILPRVSYSWNEMLEELKNKSSPTATTFTFRHVYALNEWDIPEGLLSDIPVYMHMLRHVYRSSNYTPAGRRGKSIHESLKTTVIDARHLSACLAPCGTTHVDGSVAELRQFRASCAGAAECNEQVLDPVLWRYRKPLVTRTTTALAKLGLL